MKWKKLTSFPTLGQHKPENIDSISIAFRCILSGSDNHTNQLIMEQQDLRTPSRLVGDYEQPIEIDQYHWTVVYECMIRI